MVDNPQKSFLVVAPPPTPNGDLHVGHLSGPYLGADVFTRYLRLRGRKTASAISVDLNQSYVVTTAEKTGQEPRRFARHNHDEIRRTLAAADMEFDFFGEPDNHYTTFIQEYFVKLHDAGVFAERVAPVLYDRSRRRYLFESYVQGRCPTCVGVTKGNICEVCGHPNVPATLIAATPSNALTAESVERHEVKSLVLELERYRAAIERYVESAARVFRPNLRHLVDELLAERLPAFPITYLSDWGVRAPFAGYSESVLNVWAEMYPGHFYWLNKARAAAGDPPLDATNQADHSYVQFLGFDNSYFYALAHLGLAFAAREAGQLSLVPDAIVTNEFYLLDNYKFSTSQNHLMWARDLLSTTTPDVARFHLCWTNPESQQSNFSSDELRHVTSKYLVDPMAKLFEQFHALAGLELAVPPSASRVEWLAAFRKRFERAYDGRSFSLRLAATTFNAFVGFATDLASSAWRTRRPEALGPAYLALAHLAVFAAPMMPSFASRLWAAIGRGGICWNPVLVPPTLWPSTLPIDPLSLNARSRSTDGKVRA